MDDDTFEIRLEAYGQLAMRAPTVSPSLVLLGEPLTGWQRFVWAIVDALEPYALPILVVIKAVSWAVAAWSFASILAR